tara:strand:- start:88906 stop:89238 length:333 start_codon:yes stop_codon:yes gene_type:complete
MNTVTKLTAQTFKAKLLTLIHETARDGDDISEEVAEVNTFSEERCKHEFIKVENFSKFADKLRGYVDEGGCLSQLDDMPLIKAQQERQNVMVEEFKEERVQERRAAFKLV